MTASFSSHVGATAINHEERSITLVFRNATGCIITASNLSLAVTGDEVTFKCDIKTETVLGAESEKQEVFEFLQRRENNDAFLKYIRTIARDAGVISTTTEGAPVRQLDEKSLDRATRRETTWSWQ